MQSGILKIQTLIRIFQCKMFDLVSLPQGLQKTLQKEFL